MPTEHEAMTPEDLGRSYADLVGEVPPDALPAEDSATPPSALRIIEALLFVGGTPLTAKRAREILRGLSEEQFDAAIGQLNADYRRQARPYAIQPQGAGWVLTLRPRFRYLIDKVYGGCARPGFRRRPSTCWPWSRIGNRSARPTWTRCAGPILERYCGNWCARLAQVAPLPGARPREVVYSTTPKFLEMLGLQSLDDLPKTHDLQQL